MLVSRDVDSECNRSSRDASALWPNVRREKHSDFEAGDFRCLVIVRLNLQTESHLYFAFCVNTGLSLARINHGAVHKC